VTHVNYFTPQSLRALLEVTGFEVARCWTTTPRHPSGVFALAIRAVARPSGKLGGFIASPENLEAMRQLIAPGAISTFTKLIRHPKLLWNPVLRARRKLDVLGTG
jgi:hypothetical protein